MLASKVNRKHSFQMAKIKGGKVKEKTIGIHSTLFIHAMDAHRWLV